MKGSLYNLSLLCVPMNVICNAMLHDTGVINQGLCHLKRVVEMVFRGQRVPTYRCVC